jgi:hypothetical protein
MEPIGHRADLLGATAAARLDQLLMCLLLQLQNARAASADLELRIADYFAAIGSSERLNMPRACMHSLDDAIAMMPRDWYWDVGRLPDGPSLFYANAWAIQDIYRIDHFTAPAPSIAMCCAAVMARHRAHQQSAERPKLRPIDCREA